jgi:SAM-dependent methyltransferase
MIADPDCPVCGATDWTIVGERTYRRPDSQRPGSGRALRVLFDVWVPGEQSFHVRFGACNVCAMMIYMPRPSDDDMDAKYRSLASYGDNIPSAGESPRRRRQRSSRLYEIVAPHLKGQPRDWRILDFGGGDGRLLSRFVETGADCELADYCDKPVEGVRYVGKDGDALPGEPTYDAIICSHVVEHLAEPLSVLRMLVRNLKPDGVIYVEVPVEVLRRMPAGTEPVTHCNFFVPESLAALLERSGYHVISDGLGAYPHPNGGWRLCAGAVAAPGAPAVPASPGLAAVRRYLDPSFPFMVQAFAKIWPSLPAMIVRKLVAKSRSARAGGRPKQAAVGADA